MKKIILIAAIVMLSVIIAEVFIKLYPDTPESRPAYSFTSADPWARASTWRGGTSSRDSFLVSVADSTPWMVVTYPVTLTITNKYWTATDYEVTNRFASYRQYGDVVIGFTHPVARDSFEARLMREPEFYRVLDLPSYAETVAAREAGKE